MIDSPQSDTAGLLKTGIVSLLLHIVFIIVLILSLKTVTTKASLRVYRVAIQPFSSQKYSNPPPLQAVHAPQPIPAKPQIQKKEELRPKEEVKQSKPVEEPEPLPQHQVDEQTIQKPIPLPMAETSTLNAEPNLEKEEIPPTPAALLPVESDKSTSSESSAGDGIGTGTRTGTGTGTGGSTLGGPVEGEGTGGGSRWGWLGPTEGTGPGRGTSGWGSSGGGSGSGKGGSGSGGSGKGTGTGKGGGRGGSGGGRFGGSGSGGASPRYGENPKPSYPLEARNKGYQGKVLLQVEVLSNGRVGDVFVKESSGYDVLDQSALEVLKKWRFIPATKEGVAIPCWVTVPISFQLQDSSF